MTGYLKRILTILTLLITGTILYSQSYAFPYEIPQYDYICYEDNRFQFPSDSQAFQILYEKYYHLVKEGEGNISIVHIGGSHLQADVYTHRVRERLQTIYDNRAAARGFVFPYKMAHTNNPKNFEVKYNGYWSECMNTEKQKNCMLGLSGISVTTVDSFASIYITFSEENDLIYQFNRLKVFHETGQGYYDFEIVSPGIDQEIHTNQELGYTEIKFEGYLGGMLLKLHARDTIQRQFVLYGLSFESDDPGITYNAIGVNGASISSYLRCCLFSKHLASLNPDLVVVSLGTNDAYTSEFNVRLYKNNYISLLSEIHAAVPHAAVLLTVPNDSYLYRRYINKNTEEMESAIIELAREYNCGVWNFYHIMGGMNSAYVWHKDGLMQNDKVHFTKEGYILKGDLFFNAFLKGFDNYVDGLTY